MSEVRTHRYPTWFSTVGMICMAGSFAALAAMSVDHAIAPQERLGRSLGLMWVLMTPNWFVIGYFLASAHVVRGAGATVSDGGITAFRRFGEIEAGWDDVKKVEVFPSVWGKPHFLHFETVKGDFNVFVFLWGARWILDEVRERVGERVVPAGREMVKKMRWKTLSPLNLLWTCSKCGGRFKGITCTFCEEPVLE